VSSSDPSEGTLNGWYESEVTLLNCTASNSLYIGVVNNDDQGATDILTGVYDDITDAVLAWTGDQPFKMKTFGSFD